MFFQTFMLFEITALPDYPKMIRSETYVKKLTSENYNLKQREGMDQHIWTLRRHNFLTVSIQKLQSGIWDLPCESFLKIYNLPVWRYGPTYSNFGAS